MGYLLHLQGEMDSRERLLDILDRSLVDLIDDEGGIVFHEVNFFLIIRWAIEEVDLFILDWSGGLDHYTSIYDIELLVQNLRIMIWFPLKLVLWDLIILTGSEGR